MKRHIISYSFLPGLENTGVLAPMLPLTLINGEHEFSTVALVDSGAEAGVISTVIADELKIKWRDIPAKKGFSIGSDFLFHPMEIKVSIFEDHDFYFTINVIEGVYAFKCILGRRDIFKRAEICFEQYKNQFQILFKESN